jgi:hypothetical protein
MIVLEKIDRDNITGKEDDVAVERESRSRPWKRKKGVGK